MIAGYLRRSNKQGIYFREIYALLYNINRGEKTAPISGEEVIHLPGEKVKKGARTPRIKKRTQAEMDDLVRRINAS